MSLVHPQQLVEREDWSAPAIGRAIRARRRMLGVSQAELAARGFLPGAMPGALVIGWNSRHTAMTLPDGRGVASGEHGGVTVGGPGAYQKQFTNHMYLPEGTEQ